MKKMKFKIGDIVQFGTIKTKVVKMNIKDGCKHCALETLCDSIYQDDVPVNIQTEIERMTGGCSAIDVDGTITSVYFEEIVEKKEE